MVRLSIAILVFGLALTNHSRAQEYNHKKYKDLFPSDDLIVLNNELTTELKVDRNGLAIEEKYIMKRMYLTENLASYNDEKVYYNSFENISSIKASTHYINQFNRYDTRKVSDIETKDVLVNGIFFGDVKSKSFLYPTIGPGSITELTYKKEIKNPRFINPFSFTASFRTLESRISVITDENVKIGYKIFGPHADSVKYEQVALKRKKIRHTWSTFNLPKIPNERGAPNSSYYRTQIIPYIEYFINKSGDTVRVSGTVKDLYNWYSILINKINEQESIELIQVVNKFKTSSKSEEELIKNIYGWVQENIKYIAFEDGYGGFIPRPSNLVFDRKFGDCKDMANLLKKMLELAGFEDAFLTWIGTRDRPYSYEELATPLVDNHMITVLKINNEVIYLDATNAYNPYGLPSSFIQGKQALVGIDQDNFELHYVPVVEKKVNQRVDSLNLMIKGDTLSGVNTRYLSGYRRVDMDHILKRTSPADYRRFFNNYLSKGSNTFELIGFDHSQLDKKRTNQTSFKYKFQLPGYVRKIKNKLYLNPFLNKDYVLSFDDFEERELAYEDDYKFLDKELISINIPEGYELDFLPESKQINHEKYGYSIKYNEENSVLSISLEIYQDFLLLETSEIPEFKAYLSDLEEQLRSTVSLKTNSN